MGYLLTGRLDDSRENVPANLTGEEFLKILIIKKRYIPIW